MTRPAADQVLFVFAHQDDEMAVASRILYEVAKDAAVHCVYLTDGSGGRATTAIRDQESRAALTELGVRPENVFFPGSTIPIADGALPEHLEPALRALERIAPVKVTRIYCLAWEGGHQDHDASHLVATAFAARRGILDRCYELPLYRGSPLPRLFRVLSPASKGTTWQRRRLPFREAIRSVLPVRHYASQRHSWRGLFPELFAKVVLLRREVLRPVDVGRISSRPHEGTLLYESRFGYAHERFEAATRPFIQTHLS